MRIDDKLAILADAATYDVSCASSGSRRKNARRRLGMVYDGQRTHAIQVDVLAAPTGDLDETAEEHACQRWWQRSVDAATIDQRANPRLHRRQLPRRHGRHQPGKAPRRIRS